MREVDVGSLLEQRRLGAFHWLILLLGVLILFVDGLDFSDDKMLEVIAARKAVR